MRFENGMQVRVKIPGHRTYGQVVEVVAPETVPTARPGRFYTEGGAKPTWSSSHTDTPSASETILVRLSENHKLYRVLPSMLERA